MLHGSVLSPQLLHSLTLRVSYANINCLFILYKHNYSNLGQASSFQKRVKQEILFFFFVVDIDFLTKLMDILPGREPQGR